MPNGQWGEGWVDSELMGMYDRYGVTLTGEEIRRRRESVEQRMQRRREVEHNQTLREFYHTPIYNNTSSRSFTVDTSNWSFGSFDNGMWATPPPKPKRPTRPVSAIFYPMVNECGY